MTIGSESRSAGARVQGGDSPSHRLYGLVVSASTLCVFSPFIFLGLGITFLVDQKHFFHTKGPDFGKQCL